jgi:ATP synthase protein I
MSQPDDDSQQALRRLDRRLETFSADRARKGGAAGSPESGIGEGYRLLGEVIGGVLGGLGLGYAVDHYAHTTPFGIVIGLLAGTAASAYAAFKSADRTARKATPAPDLRDGDDEED